MRSGATCLLKSNKFILSNFVKSSGLSSNGPFKPVIVDSETMGILSTGYNGSPKGTEHCTISCLTREPGSDFLKCREVHAELNAILHAAHNGSKTKNSTMYLTTTPCVFCARTIINSGIKEVRAMTKYHHEDAIDLLSDGGVRTVIISPVELRHLLKVWQK